ncbi:hypothetical protein GCM10011391_12670 [Pullulanibacillus camelliae]|uniref:Nuclear transport factor 2 family protein n=2 Tax=Pullulanibacillus camelliae TaxID=1707096 RepID=A0A8J2VNV2_9BACL|nr:hypothetical protein GCM10011391_12670 [Pullulanibacillus camelliae]
MNKQQAYEFLKEIYHEIIINMNTQRIPHYFSDTYIQVTDGVHTNRDEFINHIKTLKTIVQSIQVSPFFDFLFDQDKQTATLRYHVNVHKKNGDSGDIEVIAIFELNDYQIVRCNELTFPLNKNESFQNIGTINKQ